MNPVTLWTRGVSFLVALVTVVLGGVARAQADATQHVGLGTTAAVLIFLAVVAMVVLAFGVAVAMIVRWRRTPSTPDEA